MLIGHESSSNAELPSWKRALFRHVLRAGLVATLTALVVILIPNRYVSEARILPADARSASGGLAQMAAAAAAVGVSVPGQETADAVYVDILASRWLRESLLTSTYQFKARSWRFGAEQPREETLLTYLKLRNLDRGVLDLKKRITVTRDMKTKLLTLQVETNSPTLSQAVVQKAVRLLEVFVTERAQTRGTNKARFATQRLKEAQESLDEAETTLRSFLDVNRNYLQSPDPRIRIRGGRLEAELRIRQQLVTTLALNREQALLDEKNDMPILNVLDAGNLPVEKNGPYRTLMLMGVFGLGLAASWAFDNRRRLVAQLVNLEGGALSSRVSLG